MTPEVAVSWIAYVTKRPVPEVLELGLEHDQLATLGRWLAANPLINPPTDIPVKVGEFVCQCGCGERFTAEWRTKRPQYLNATHKARAYRARKRERQDAALLAERGQPVGLVWENGRGRIQRA